MSRPPSAPCTRRSPGWRRHLGHRPAREARRPPRPGLGAAPPPPTRVARRKPPRHAARWPGLLPGAERSRSVGVATPAPPQMVTRRLPGRPRAVRRRQARPCRPAIVLAARPAPPGHRASRRRSVIVGHTARQRPRRWSAVSCPRRRGGRPVRHRAARRRRPIGRRSARPARRLTVHPRRGARRRAPPTHRPSQARRRPTARPEWRRPTAPRAGHGHTSPPASGRRSGRRASVRRATPPARQWPERQPGARQRPSATRQPGAPRAWAGRLGVATRALWTAPGRTPVWTRQAQRSAGPRETSRRALLANGRCSGHRRAATGRLRRRPTPRDRPRRQRAGINSARQRHPRCGARARRRTPSGRHADLPPAGRARRPVRRGPRSTRPATDGRTARAAAAAPAALGRWSRRPYRARRGCRRTRRARGATPSRPDEAAARRRGRAPSQQGRAPSRRGQLLRPRGEAAGRPSQTMPPRGQAANQRNEPTVRRGAATRLRSETTSRCSEMTGWCSEVISP